MGHRKTRRIYDKALTYEKVYSAWNTVSHTCKNKQGLFEFMLFAHVRVDKILEELKQRKYYPHKYRCFMIFEPKPRLVMSQSIRDKVVNHFVAREYLLPLLERTLIDTNVATRTGMGSSYATKMLRRYLSQMMAKRPGAKIYAMKVDVSKYFYTIDHEILFEKLERRIKDGDVLEILRRIVGETNKPYINRVIDGFNAYYHTDIPHYEQGKGLSIGAMTSQFLAIYYLNDLDHYIKEVLGCRWFIRYMDDFFDTGV
ncbi:RNA-directed DNA polymerase [Candidatus Saccharibacteria bacterium]|nr:RNA-directed DNA polymerase [Candidatus Saccharibacteria bacterium]